MTIQEKIQDIHHKYGVSEKANYEIQKYVEELIKKDRSEQLLSQNVITSSTNHIKLINKEGVEDQKSNAYWAGMLSGGTYAWGIANEIVLAIECAEQKGIELAKFNTVCGAINCMYCERGIKKNEGILICGECNT